MRDGTPLRRGFALLAALALLVTISVVALELGVTARPRRLALAGAAERVAATAAAAGGVEHALAVLTRLEPIPLDRRVRDPARAPDPWGVAHGMVLGPAAAGAYVYRAELRDPFATLHLNGASEDQLRRLLLALRVDARRADRLAQAIADWRDADALRRANGAEHDDYLRAGLPLLPDDGPFAAVGRLRFVLGMTDSLYRALAPYVTVMGDAGVNLNAAPRPVLLALPGMTEEAVAFVLGQRAAGARVTDLDRLAASLSPGARTELRLATPALRNIVGFETREIVVTSEAAQPGGGTRARIDALVSRDAGGRVIWRRASP